MTASVDWEQREYAAVRELYVALAKSYKKRQAVMINFLNGKAVEFDELRMAMMELSEVGNCVRSAMYEANESRPDPSPIVVPREINKEDVLHLVEKIAETYEVIFTYFPDMRPAVKKADSGGGQWRMWAFWIACAIGLFFLLKIL